MVKVKVAERFDNEKSPRIKNSRTNPNIHTVKVINRSNKSLRNNKLSLRTKLSLKKILYTRNVTESLKNFTKQSWDSYVSMAVHLFALLLLSWIIIEETNVYNINPTGTVVENALYPIQNIDFPGIAICNINLMSRERTHRLAEGLWLMEKVRKIENVTLDRMKDLFKYFGHLFAFRDWEQEPGDLKLLQAILNIAFDGNYDVLKLMEDTVTRCRGVLKFCSWDGEIRSCDELFVPRWTQDGYCCTFNYVRWTENFKSEPVSDFRAEIRRSTAVGAQFGLRIYMEPQLDDYYYTILRGPGFKVLVYSASDYPDAPSGGMRELLVKPQTDTFVKLKATSYYSTPDIMQFDMRKRGCLFNSELHDLYEGSYSYSQCMMLCRTRDIFKTCKCVPFFYPTPPDLDNSKDCDFSHLTCLRENRMKWWSVAPELVGAMDDPMPIDQDDELNSEQIDCDCLPACENVEYGAGISVSDVHNSDTAWIDFVMEYDTVCIIWGIPFQIGHDEKDNTTMDALLLNIRFAQTTIVRLKQDVLYYWYDLMSNYGGLCCLFLGLSVLTPIELVYLWFSRKCQEQKRSNEFLVNSWAIRKFPKFDERTLYWREIMPTKRRY